jgi:hypothetical protein
MGLRHNVAVYFGLADETAESREAREEALLQTSPARLVLSAILGAIVTGAAIGLIRCLLDGETVTVARVIEKGWLVAGAVALAGTIRELWDRRQAR